MPDPSSRDPPSQLCCTVDLHIDLHALAAHLERAEVAAMPTDDAGDATPNSFALRGHARVLSTSSVASVSAERKAASSSSDAALRISRLLPDVLPGWVLGAASGSGRLCGGAAAEDASAVQSIASAAASIVAGIHRELLFGVSF